MKELKKNPALENTKQNMQQSVKTNVEQPQIPPPPPVFK